MYPKVLLLLFFGLFSLLAKAQNKPTIEQLQQALTDCSKDRTAAKDCRIKLRKQMVKATYETYGPLDPQYGLHLLWTIREMNAQDKSSQALPFLQLFDQLAVVEQQGEPGQYPQAYKDCLCELPFTLIGQGKKQVAKGYIARCLSLLNRSRDLQSVNQQISYVTLFADYYYDEPAYVEALTESTDVAVSDQIEAMEEAMVQNAQKEIQAAFDPEKIKEMAEKFLFDPQAIGLEGEGLGVPFIKLAEEQEKQEAARLAQAVADSIEAEQLLKSASAEEGNNELFRMINRGLTINAKVREATLSIPHLRYPNCLDTAVLHIGEASHLRTAKAWLSKSIAGSSLQSLNQIAGTYRVYILQELQIAAEANLAYISRAIKKHPELAAYAYDQALRLKGLSAAYEKHIRRQVAQNKDSKAAELYRDLQQQKRKLNKLYISGQENLYGKSVQLDEKIQTIVELEEALYRELKNSWSEDEGSGWKEVRGQLKKGEAAIEIVRFLDRENKDWTDQVRYAALVLRADSEQPLYISLPNGNDMEDSHFLAFQNLRGHEKDRLTRDTVYQTFWKAIEQELGGIRQIYFSPAGIYHLINPAMLPLKADGSDWLLDRYQFTLLQSTRSLARPPSASTNKGESILFGHPLFADGKEDLADDFINKQTSWQSLPYTEIEVRHIAERLQKYGHPARVFTGTEANETQLKNIRSPKILHIASHAYFTPIRWDQIYLEPGQRLSNSNYPSFRGLIGKRPKTLSRDPADEQDQHSITAYMDSLIIKSTWFDPALNSGIVLSRANFSDYFKGIKGEEDGIMYAYEVNLLDLTNTQLVVLSACDTGQGLLTAAGGVDGLKSAFQQAGAEDMIITLWRVVDDVAQTFMSFFYDYWLEEGLTKEEAFRQAQLELREGLEMKEIRNWGAFVFIRN